MKKISLIALLLLIYSIVTAQDLKLAGVDYFNYGNSAVKGAPGNTKIAFQEAGAFVNVPTPLKDGKTIVVNGIRYAWVQPTVEGGTINGDNSFNFQTISYTFGVIHKFKNNWTGTIMLSPTLASDFKSSLSGADFIMQGYITLNKKISNNLIIGGGLTYNTRLGIPLPLPAFQLLYKNERHRVYILLPAVAEYLYSMSPNKKINVGFRTALNGAYFNYTADDNSSSSNKVDKIHYSRCNVGPLVNYRIGKNFQMEAFGGICTLRKYRFRDVNRNDIKFDARSSGFFNIGFSMVLPSNERK